MVKVDVFCITHGHREKGEGLREKERKTFREIFREREKEMERFRERERKRFREKEGMRDLFRDRFREIEI